jgi:hypothetical protein
MKQSLDYFLKEAEKCVPHLSPDERIAWAKKCYNTHPGFTELPTSIPHVRFKSEPISPIPTPIPTSPRFDWWRWIVLVLLLFCSVRQVKCQDPVIRNIPIYWVTSAPAGSCSGILIEYVYTGTPPSFWGCSAGTWTQLNSSATGTVTSIDGNNGITASPAPINSTGTLGLSSIAAGGLLCNNTSGTAVPTIAHCTISVPQSVSGTTAISASAPLVLNATTGNLTINKASSSQLGVVQGDGSTVFINGSGVISVPELTGNTLTSGKGCTSDGTIINCTTTLTNGTVTSIATNNGLTGGTITTTGTLGLASINNNSALCNNSGMSAAPISSNCTVTGTGNLVLAQGPTFTGSLVGINLNSGSLPTPQTGATLQLQNANSTATRVEIDSAAASAYVSSVRVDGTAASPTTLQAGDEIGGYNAFGYNSSAIVGPRAAVRLYANQNWTTSATGTYADIATTINGGTSESEVIRFENDGGVTVPSTVTGGDKGAGTINAGGLYVNGNSVATSATSPLVLNATTGNLTCSTCLTTSSTVSLPRGFGATFDGGGSALTADSTQNVLTSIPYSCTISAWTILVDTGRATFDIWVNNGTSIPTSGNSITASALPAISSGTSTGKNTTLTGWTTSVSAFSNIIINLNAVSSATKATLMVECDQTVTL